MKVATRFRETRLTPWMTPAWVALGLLLAFPEAQAAPRIGARVTANDVADSIRRTAETQIRNLIEPLLDKYCREECKLMTVQASVDTTTPDQIAPGFDDVDPKNINALAPSNARVRILIDEKVGPVSRAKLLELVQQYTDTLDFPVRIETQLTHFPQPVGSASKIAELRERLTKQFKNTLEELFKQFCPEQCMLADYDLQTELVNTEEAQYGSAGEFVEDGGVALRVKNISATVLVDEDLSQQERANVIEMAKLKTNFLKNVTLTAKSMKFPRPTQYAQAIRTYEAEATGVPAGPGSARSIASENKSSSQSSSQSSLQSSSQSSESRNSENTQLNKLTSNTTNNEMNAKQERFERFEKIERVENGDAVQAELKQFKVWGLIFFCTLLSIMLMIAIAGFRSKQNASSVHRVIQNLASDPTSSAGAAATTASDSAPTSDERGAMLARRYEIERLREELMEVFAQHPRVAKHVFTRILTEEGVETTSQYIHIFGEVVVMDMLRDPSLQSDMNGLMEFHAKNPVEISDEDKLDLLRRLHARTTAGKLAVMGSRSSNLFDFLAEMDGTQIMELIRNESLTVKSIVLTQCDAQKRSAIFAQMDEESRLKLLAELSRIDYLPRDFIFNVANALKRKRRDNPKLNTEALPGSDVLLTLLERTQPEMQRTVVKNLEMANPESARTIKSKLVSLDTLRHLRDGQLLEVVLSLRHDELLQFLKGAPADIKAAVFAKSPKDLVAELEEELAHVSVLSREAYQGIERKVLNRMKLMANEGLINLVETNERMLADAAGGVIEAGPADVNAVAPPPVNIKKVAGW